MRLIIFCIVAFWSSLSFANLGISFDEFYNKFSEQLNPYQKEMGFTIPKKSELVAEVNEQTQRYIYQIDYHTSLILMIETDLERNVTAIFTVFGADANDQMAQIRALGLYGVLMGIFNPELGDKRGEIVSSLFQELASTGKATESIQGNIKYSVIPGEFLTFTVGPAQ